MCESVCAIDAVVSLERMTQEHTFMVHAYGQRVYCCQRERTMKTLLVIVYMLVFKARSIIVVYCGSMVKGAVFLSYRKSKLDPVVPG